jgi:HJR/Mrr/RecB family endonuclease
MSSYHKPFARKDILWLTRGIMAGRRRRYRARAGAKGHDPVLVAGLLIGIAVALFFLYMHFVEIMLAITACVGAYLLYLYIGSWRREYQANKRNWSLRKLEDLRNMNPYEFEEYVAWYYEQLGYWAKRTPDSQDGGVDVELYTDFFRRDLYGIVQCKRYQEGNKVGVEEVRALYGSHADRLQYYAVVTTSDFSKFTYDEVKEKGLPVKLINGESLVQMVQKLGTSKSYIEAVTRP